MCTFNSLPVIPISNCCFHVLFSHDVFFWVWDQSNMPGKRFAIVCRINYGNAPTLNTYYIHRLEICQHYSFFTVNSISFLLLRMELISNGYIRVKVSLSYTNQNWIFSQQSIYHFIHQFHALKYSSRKRIRMVLKHICSLYFPIKRLENCSYKWLTLCIQFWMHIGD